ncbi:cation/H(+) antiporter 4-like [Pyrus ussuriensis x Pyrus communis]|uniref:Cation/H(+) antiporter 4-like n=1 Tax=Pyrus ussuriensis x Pyrus communis TaxID=2448454 RepID=A0A5N5FVT7_9ROSA|nr:cation/H(+) antiporter 4-like [Pyrus ussuriensis x Pyrus communis]
MEDDGGKQCEVMTVATVHCHVAADSSGVAGAACKWWHRLAIKLPMVMGQSMESSLPKAVFSWLFGLSKGFALGTIVFVISRFVVVVGMAVQRRGWFCPGNPSAIHVAATFAIIATHIGRRKLMAALSANMSYACIWVVVVWRPTPPDIFARDYATHDSCQFCTCISIMDTSSCNFVGLLFCDGFCGNFGAFDGETVKIVVAMVARVMLVEDMVVAMVAKMMLVVDMLVSTVAGGGGIKRWWLW